MHVLPVGAKIDIGPADDPITGVIMGVWIAGLAHVRYEVAWWNGRSREEKWLEEFEVRSGKAVALQSIGFAEAAK